MTARPMPLAEANECCGQHRWGEAFDPRSSSREHDAESFCDNCPLLIEQRRERLLRELRAL